MRLRPIVALVAVAVLTGGCRLRRVPHAFASASGMAPADFDALVDTPGPVHVDIVVSARWQVPLHGLVDLKDPAAADLADEKHPIVLPVAVLVHPTRGIWVVDTGIDRTLAAGEPTAVRGVLRSFLGALEPVEALGDLVGKYDAPVAGVLLTHTHIDHVLGLPDLDPAVPVYAGPGELEETGLQALAMRSTYRALFDGRALSDLDPARAVALGDLRGWDLVGDGSIWAIASPGHTPGSTAYLARTPEGPVLAVGDTSHTWWGWEHGVTPGTYTADHAENAASLARLRAFAAKHPGMRILVGHELAPSP
jgi:glyoxylase-like metal-dependent hydrolase (beta-lactamase superfamily II)